MTLTLIFSLSFGLSLVLALVLTPVVIKLANRWGMVVQPREDRWHRRPTALLGGMAIFASVMIPYALFAPWTPETIGIFIAGAAVFALGLIDDLIEISPQRKLLIQILIAAAVVMFGVRIKIIPFPPLAALLTIFWIVGITNAINILDNMDGLSSGITFVASACSFIYAAQAHMPFVGLFALALAGASLGFLVYNFNPAKIFMGDCGSLFLGMSLSLLTIVGTWREATNLMAALLLPIALLAVPIFDTTLVSFIRTQNGRSIAQGGRDHSSHRLVFLGLSERRAVLVLMGIAALFGSLAVLLEDLTMVTAWTVLGLLVVGLSVFGIFLGGVRVYEPTGKRRFYLDSPLFRYVLMYKKQIFQLLVDTTLLATAYILAYLLRFGQALNVWEISLIERTLPIVLLANLAAFAWIGLYKGDWRYVSIHDLSQVFKAVSLGWVGTAGMVILFFGDQRPPLGLLATDYALTLLFIGGVRLSHRVMKEYFAKARMESDPETIPVLILGAGDGGEFLLRELKNNPKLKKRPIGFIDDDPAKKGLFIHGLKVLGNRGDLVDLANKYRIREVHIAIRSADRSDFADVEAVCRDNGLTARWINPFLEGLKDED